MKTILPILILTALASAVTPATQPATSPAAIPFDTHDGYFVSNKFEPNEPASFAVIRDQKTFDAVIGIAMVMGDKSHRLPDNAFESKNVLAAIHRGKANWTYAVQKVEVEKGVLTIRYTATSKPSDSAEFACPLIVSVPKGDYSVVEFVENGVVLKRIDWPVTVTDEATGITVAVQPAIGVVASQNGKRLWELYMAVIQTSLRIENGVVITSPGNLHIDLKTGKVAAAAVPKPATSEP